MRAPERVVPVGTTRGHTAPVAVLALLILTSCGEAGPSSGEAFVRDSVGIRIVSSLVDEASPACRLLEPTVRIGAVAGDTAAQLFDVRDAVRLGDGRIAALNAGTSQVRIYGPDGRLVTSFGRRGEGPGEFRNVWSLDLLVGDTLVVGEYRPWRFSFFTDAGDHVRSVEPHPPIIERPQVAFVLSSGDRFLIGERWLTDEQEDFADRSVGLVFRGPDGVAEDTLGTFFVERTGFLSRELRLLGGPIFGARASFAMYRGDTIAYASGRSEQVELWGADGRPARIVRWSSQDRAVRAEDVREWKRQVRERAGEVSGRTAEFLEARVGDDRPVAERFPAIAEWDGLRASRGGMIWIREYRRPFDQGPDRWLVFDPEGTLACTAELPATATIMDVGEDWVLARETDQVGVEYLVEWPVEAPRRAAGDTSFLRRILVLYLADQMEWTLQVAEAGRNRSVAAGVEGLERGVRDLAEATGGARP